MAGAIGLILNVIFMYGLVEYCGMVKIMAKITATFIVFLWNFAVRKYYIYKI
jgi:putative flippase GtrA